MQKRTNLNYGFSLILGLLLICFVNMQVVAQSSTLRMMKYTGGTAFDIGYWQHNVRLEMFKLMKLDDLMSDRQKIPFNTKVIRSENKGAYELKEIEINSTPNRRIRLIITFPLKGKGPFPAVVSIHGHDGAQEVVYNHKSDYKGFADELASRNYITIAPFVSQHTVYENGRLLMGERLFDCIRSVDYLESLTEVDKSRIGCAGHSLGGEMTMWLAAMDKRVQAAVVASFLTKIDQLEENHCMCWKFDGLREMVDFTDIYALIAPRPLLFEIGESEALSQFPLTLAREAFTQIQPIYADFKVPEKVMLVPHEGAHSVDVPVLVNFMAKYLANKQMAY